MGIWEILYDFKRQPPKKMSVWSAFAIYYYITYEFHVNLNDTSGQQSDILAVFSLKELDLQ